MLFAAGGAPGSPEIEHHHFAEQRRKREFVAFQAGERKLHRILELRVRIEFTQFGAARRQLRRSGIVRLQNQIAKPGFGTVQLAIQFTHLRAVAFAIHGRRNASRRW